MCKLILGMTCALALVSYGNEQISPFDDAIYWFRGGVDQDGSGIYESGSKEFRDVAHAADATHAFHSITLAQTGADYEPLGAHTGPVMTPLANRVLADAPYLHLPQRFVTNEIYTAEDGTQYPIGKLCANHLTLPDFFSVLPSGAAGSEYTFFIRFRDNGRVSDRQIEHGIFQLGYAWSIGDNTNGGLAVNLYHNGADMYPRIYCGPNIMNLYNAHIPYQHWVDLAVIVRPGTRIEMATCANVSDVAGAITNQTFKYDYVTVSDGKTTAAIDSTRHWVRRIGGEEAGISAVYTNGFLGGHHDTHGNKVKSSRIDIQSIAFWKRALATNEIQRVFAEQRPALVRVGLANGSSSEFARTASAININRPYPENWNPVLNADNPTASVAFSIANGQEEVSQYLRIRPVPGSVQAKVRVKLDDRIIGEPSVTDDGKDTLLYVKGKYLTVGAHTISFTRIDTKGGDFAIDAFSLAGSWRIGTGGSWGGMSHESQYPYQYLGRPRVFPLTDGNLEHFARGLSGGPGSGNDLHDVPFNVSADLLDWMRDAKFSFYVSQGKGQQYDFLVNGKSFGTGVVPADGTMFEFTVPVKMLKAGENTFRVQQLSTGWGNCSIYTFELGHLITGGAVLLK